MVDEIRDLIDKIHEEGIRAAEERAHQIEAAAQARANEILEQARREAERMVAAAQERIRREEEREKALLAQAGRDFLLSLRNEINAMLGRLMVAELRQALTPEALSALIPEVVKHYGAKEGGEAVVFLKKEDLDALEKHFLQRLSGEAKKDILLRPSEEVSGGFILSFDGGRSCFDFTDQALADYIGTYLKPKLQKILGEAVKE